MAGSSVPGVDPARVSTPDELAACLDGLRRRRGLSYEAMAAAAENLRPQPGGRRLQPLPKTTIGEIVTGKRLPGKNKLLTFLAVCQVTPADTAQWLAAWERAATADLARPPGGVRVRDANPRLLGVHAAIHAETASGELPSYVSRDVDDKLRAALRTEGQRGCFILVLGSSSVGKTRTLYEAVLDVLPDWWLVHPDPDNPDEIRALVAAAAPRTVIWLDELQRYLGSDLTAGSVRILLGQGAVVAATMWPDEFSIRIVPRFPGREDPHAQGRELLELAEVLDLAGELSAAEKDRAQQLARRDDRLDAALASEDGGMTQVLAAGPQLVRWWEQAPPYAQAVITAAVDARRLGVNSFLPPKLLAAAVPGYLTAAHRAAAPGDWFQRALDYAVTPLHGAASALTPMASDSHMGRADGYLAADYLLQYGKRVRRTVCPPLTLWENCLELADARDLLTLGRAAYDRLLLDLAERFYRAAESIPESIWPLADLLDETGRSDEAEQVLRAALSPNNPDAATRLGWLLIGSDREEEAERLLHDEVAAGNPYARRPLAILLERQKRFKEAESVLRAGIVAGDPDSPQRLGLLLMGELEQPDEAERVLRAAIAARQPESAVPLAFLLADQNLNHEAEQILGDAIVTGHPYARFRLVELLRELHREEEAERICWEGIEVGDVMSRLALDRLLREQDRLDEAEQMWHEGVEKGERDAPRRLAELLRDQGRLDEAERVLRDGVAAGHRFASDHLYYFLEEVGRHEEAEQLKRYGLTLDGRPASTDT